MKYKTISMLCLLVALAGLNACQPQETDLSFETIEQRDASGTRQIYQDKQPGLIGNTAKVAIDLTRGVFVAHCS